MPKYIIKHTYRALVTEEIVVDVPDILPEGEGVEWLLAYPWDWMQHHPGLIKKRGFQKASDSVRRATGLDDDYEAEHFDIEEMNILDEIVETIDGAPPDA